MTQRYVLEALKRAIIWKDLYKSTNGEFLELYTQHQTGRKLKCLHIENGGEFTIIGFRGSCDSHGIIREVIALLLMNWLNDINETVVFHS